MESFMPNPVAVLFAGLIPMLLGSVWYGPLFGKMWMGMIGKTEEELRENFNPIKSYVFTFVMALVMGFILAHLLEAYSVATSQTGLWEGMQGGFWCWLGFVITIGYQHIAFNDQKIGLYLLNMGYNLLALLGMGAILGIWR
ncbi:MAG: DUF1761 domain-containing protein [Bacteroidetes bacterium]|nr:MAG: DUF1761 domain-containing protein [Bacteroidota bacterium]